MSGRAPPASSLRLHPRPRPRPCPHRRGRVDLAPSLRPASDTATAALGPLHLYSRAYPCVRIMTTRRLISCRLQPLSPGRRVCGRLVFRRVG
ncbi:unnamed protein product [Protopolystoma xenopodis]|uniref:Uncharacterized protein n=1 Tax=Protopolystoma xenopodis TaxID=117903 RepID=A0A448XJS2_9PLAT|nr:unnamed protein product [Protopolystoma xenopodis]